jgi:hypothetical protein
MVFLRVRIITLGGSATSGETMPSSVGWPGHGDDRIDHAGVDVLTLVQAIVEALQHVAGAGGGFGLALDLHLGPARGDVNAKPVLDRDQVAVELAEQRAEEVRLGEFELDAGARAGACRGGFLGRGHIKPSARRRPGPKNSGVGGLGSRLSPG